MALAPVSTRAFFPRLSPTCCHGLSLCAQDPVASHHAASGQTPLTAHPDLGRALHRHHCRAFRLQDVDWCKCSSCPPACAFLPRSNPTILYSVVRVHPRGAGEHVKSSRSSTPTIILPPSLVIVPRCSSESQPPPALHAEHHYMGRLSRGCRALPNHIRDRMRWNSPGCQASKILASTSTTFIFIAPVITRCTY